MVKALIRNALCQLGRHKWIEVEGSAVYIGIDIIAHYRCDNCNAEDYMGDAERAKLHLKTPTKM